MDVGLCVAPAVQPGSFSTSEGSLHMNCVRCSSAGSRNPEPFLPFSPPKHKRGAGFSWPGPTSGECWAPCPYYRHLLELRGCLSHVFGACFRLINDRTCRLGPRGSFSMMKIHLTFKIFLDSEQLD